MEKCNGCPKCKIMSCCGCRHGFAPSDSSQSHHICDERGPCDGKGYLPDPRTDSDRYAELRKLVEDCQREAMDPASPLVVFDNALRLVLDWRHR